MRLTDVSPYNKYTGFTQYMFERSSAEACKVMISLTRQDLALTNDDVP